MKNISLTILLLLIICIVIWSSSIYILEYPAYKYNKEQLNSSFFTQSEKDKIVDYLKESNIKEIDIESLSLYNEIFIKFNNNHKFSKSLTLERHYSLQYVKNLKLLNNCNFGFNINIKNNTLNFKTYNFKKECFSHNDTKTVIFEQLDIIKDIALENLEEIAIAEKIKQENLKSHNK